MFVTGCHYDKRDLGDDLAGDSDSDGDDGDSAVGADADSHPHAVIAFANTTTMVLGIPSQGNFTLNGTPSYTEEGTPIAAYAWTSTCVTISDPALATFSVDATSITDGCAITLTVTDENGATDSVTVTVVHRGVGGYVSSTLPCQATYDATFAVDQGTTTNPWCSVDAVVDALADNAIADFYFDAAAFTFHKTYALPAAGYHGGYSRSDSAWAKSGGALTTVSGDTTDVNATLIRLSQSGAYVFDSFVISRSAKCDGDCVNVEVSDTSVTMNSVMFQRVGNATSPSANPSTGAVVAIAVNDTAGTTVLSCSSSQIASDAADVSTALAVRGRASVRLSSVSLMPGTGGRYAFGVRATAGAAVVIDTDSTGAVSTITIDDDSAAHATAAYAVAAGRSSVLDSADDCGGAPYCDAAASVQMKDATILVDHVRYASALAVFGGSAVALTGASAVVRGGSVDGVRLVGAASYNASEGSVTATYIQGTSSSTQYAHGLTDGVLSSGEPLYGTAAMNVSGGFYSASSVLSMSGDLIGMQLLATSNANLTGTHVNTSGMFGTTITNGVVAMWTRGVGRLLCTACAIDGTSKPSGELISAAMVDGVTSSPHYGSTAVELTGCTFAAMLDGSQDYTLRECVRFNGTQAVTVTGGTAKCQTEGAPQSQQLINVAGIHTYETGSVVIDGLTVNTTNQNYIAPPGTTYVIGILDGGLPGETGTHASASLLLNNLQIKETYITPILTPVGVWLRSGSAGAVTPRLFNSRIVVSTSGGNNVGVVIEGQGALMDYNTVRYGECRTLSGASCTGTGVGLELIGTAAYEVEVFANTFSSQIYSSASAMAAILDLTTSNDTPGLDELAYLTFGGDGTGAIIPALYRWQAPSAATLPVLSSGASSGMPGGSATVSNNASSTVVFCGATDIVSPTTVAGTNAVPQPLTSDADYATVGALLVTGGDAKPRVGPSYDAGATERLCP